MKFKIEIEKYGKQLPKTGGHGSPVRWKKVADGEVYIGVEKQNGYTIDNKDNKKYLGVFDTWLFVCVKDKEGNVISIYEEELD